MFHESFKNKFSIKKTIGPPKSESVIEMTNGLRYNERVALQKQTNPSKIICLVCVYPAQTDESPAMYASKGNFRVSHDHFRGKSPWVTENGDLSRLPWLTSRFSEKGFCQKWKFRRKRSRFSRNTMNTAIAQKKICKGRFLMRSRPS